MVGTPRLGRQRREAAVLSSYVFHGHKTASEMLTVARVKTVFSRHLIVDKGSRVCVVVANATTLLSPWAKLRQIGHGGVYARETER
jgi:hypothetical protein